MYGLALPQGAAKKEVINFKVRRSLRLLKIEMAITATLAAGALMPVYYDQIGVGADKIGTTQAVFTIILLAVTARAGRFADTVSRRLSNMFGDLLSMSGFLWFIWSDNLLGLIIAEGLLAIGAAFTTGADDALLKSYTDRFDRSGSLLKKAKADTTAWSQIAQISLLAAAAAAWLISPWLIFVVSALPFAVGFVLSWFMRESGEDEQGDWLAVKAVARIALQQLKHLHPAHAYRAWQNRATAARSEDDVSRKRKIADVRRETWNNPQLRWLIIAHAVGFRMTTPLNWVLSVIMIAAGAPVYWVGFVWIAKPLAVLAGAFTAKRIAERFTIPWLFLAPTGLILVGLGGMAFELNHFTICLFGLLAFAEGWLKSTMTPTIQQFAPKADQATVLSLDEQLCQLLYIPLVFGLPLIGVTWSWEIMARVALVLFAGATVFIGVMLVRTFPRHQER